MYRAEQKSNSSTLSRISNGVDPHNGTGNNKMLPPYEGLLLAKIRAMIDIVHL
jgi:hypothetical protein